MAYSREELLTEAKRRGLAVPPDLKQNDFSKEEVRAEALKRGLIKPHEESYLRSA